MHTTDILIIGGGAIALAIATELALQGAKVTVLSRDFRQAATHAAAGMLAPQAEALSPGPMLELCFRSRSLYPEWTRKLEALTGLNTEYWPCGILAPAFGEDIDSGIAPSHQPAADRQWLDQAAIHQFQPQLSPQVVGGWWFPKDAQVNNRTLARVLWAAVRELGVNLYEGVSAEAIHHQQGRITRIETTAGDWQAEQYILATGAWSGQLLSVPVVPRKGQMLAVQAIIPTQEAVQPLQQVLFGTQIYLVPRRDGQIVIGATSENVGFTPDNTPAGIQSLLAAAIALYPPIKDFPIREFWWGFRPATPDGYPILGYGPYRNLILATGHYRNGILLAPVTAILLVDLILRHQADSLLAHFDWQRFKPRL